MPCSPSGAVRIKAPSTKDEVVVEGGIFVLFVVVNKEGKKTLSKPLIFGSADITLLEAQSHIFVLLGAQHLYSWTFWVLAERLCRRSATEVTLRQLQPAVA